MTLSISKFYINNNRVLQQLINLQVIDHPNEIRKKEELNEYTREVAAKKDQQE